jgi:hypothetical protein
MKEASSVWQQAAMCFDSTMAACDNESRSVSEGDDNDKVIRRQRAVNQTRSRWPRDKECAHLVKTVMGVDGLTADGPMSGACGLATHG